MESLPEQSSAIVQPVIHKHPSSQQLLAYVAGTLDREQTNEIQIQAQGDEELAARIAVYRLLASGT